MTRIRIRTRSRRRSERRRKRKEEKEKDKDKEKEKENSNSKEKKTGGRGGKKGAAKKNSKSPTNAVIDVEAARKKTAENQREKAKLAQIQLGTAGLAAGQHHNCLPNPKQVSERLRKTRIQGKHPLLN